MQSERVRHIMSFEYILLIDDEMSVNYFHEYLIEDLHLTNRILKARNVEEGYEQLLKLNQAQDLQPSIIFLDINMPRYNGFEFIDMHAPLLGSLIERGASLVILTTSSNPKDLKQAQSYDLISSYEQKPMTIEMLERLAREFGNGIK